MFIKLKKSSNIKTEKKKFTTDLNTNDCHISKASAEIMLDRVCNGKTIEFPFSK